MEIIYLDNCATTQVDDEAARLACKVMTEAYGNPSSPHAMGLEALNILTKARHQIAMTLGVMTECVFFTSGGTESNNLAILGVADRAGEGRIVTTSIEHHSVLDALAGLNQDRFEVVMVPPREGMIQAGDIVAAVNDKTILVTVMAVNNETGEMLPLKEIIKGVREKNPKTMIHCDCVQGFGKIPFKCFEYDVDLLSASGHKIHAPKGVGALYVKSDTRIAPRSFGGRQEGALRPGTEAIPMIAAFGHAAENAVLKMRRNIRHVTAVKDHLTEVLAHDSRIVINSPPNSSPYVLNISTMGIPTDKMLSALRMRKVLISGSAACSRGAKSHVLQAMGLSAERVDSALRIGLSKDTTIEQAERLADIVLQELHALGE